MNALRKQWQLDRIERAITLALSDDTKHEECFWPCVHLASSLAGGDIRLCFRVLRTRLEITSENVIIRTQMFWQRFYFIRIKGMSKADYEAKLDGEFEEAMQFIIGRHDKGQARQRLQTRTAHHLADTSLSAVV